MTEEFLCRALAMQIALSTVPDEAEMVAEAIALKIMRFASEKPDLSLRPSSEPA